MKSHPRDSRPSLRALPNWTLANAERATPYLTAILRALRDSWLEWRMVRRRAMLLADRPGRPDRQRLAEIADLARQEADAQRRLDDARDELASLGAECPDPNRGLALLPFVHQRVLAWFVIDLHEGGTLRWRYHSDESHRRRWPVELRG
jgi:hypothetical protein